VLVEQQQQQQEAAASCSSSSSSSTSASATTTTTSTSSLLSKVPVVRSISFLEKHRSKSRDAADRDHAASNAATIISTPADRRSQQHLAGELREEVLLPGFVADKTPNHSIDIDPLSGKTITNNFNFVIKIENNRNQKEYDQSLVNGFSFNCVFFSV
jgi:hypothetical protein